MAGYSRFAHVCVAGIVFGCGGGNKFESAPADVDGEYSVALTNRENGCEFQDWEVGGQTTAVPLTIEQKDEEVTGQVTSFAGLVLWALTGNATFRGTAGPSSVTMEIQGNVRHREGACEFWVDATLEAEVSGETLSGTITYEKRPLPGADCSLSPGCSSIQAFNATRPPN